MEVGVNMDKVIVREKPLTRQFLADPHCDKTHKERLTEAKAIDLTDNHKIEVLNSGYWRISPIDKTKIFK